MPIHLRPPDPQLARTSPHGDLGNWRIGQPTKRVSRRDASRQRVHYADSKPKKRKETPQKKGFVFDEGKGSFNREAALRMRGSNHQRWGATTSTAAHPARIHIVAGDARDRDGPAEQHWRSTSSAVFSRSFARLRRRNQRIWLTRSTPQAPGPATPWNISVGKQGRNSELIALRENR